MKSLSKVGCMAQDLMELAVLRRMRSPFWRLWGFRSSTLTLPTLWSSITRQGPMTASSGRSSRPRPFFIKWIGPSMWVPVWAVMERWETLQGAPLMPIWAIKWILTAGSPCQWTMPSTTGSETSIQSEAILECDYVFDGGAVFVAEEEITVVFDRVAAGDEGFNGLRPAFLEDTEVADGVLESGAIGVDGADDCLVFENDVAHDVVAGGRDGFAGRWDAGEDEDAVLAEDAEDIEGDVGFADAFVDEVDVADPFGELVGGFDFGRDVSRADGFQEGRFWIRLLHAAKDVGFEAVGDEGHGAKDADGTGAEDDRVEALTGLIGRSVR